jgi:ABC-2 type transport system permease protein
MTGFSRYLRLMYALARYGLARELAFRGNFLVKIAVEVLWLGILLVFYRTVFAQTSVVADWDESQYLFFVGCYFALEGLIETLFLENCNEFADLVRSGDLDFFLLQPIDEQFLITCHNIDWSTAPNVLMGGAVMGLALGQMGWTFDAGQVARFLLLFVCGVLIAYSFLVLLTSTAVWLVRNQSLMEMWWLVTSLMRYPREIFARSWAAPVGWVFTFLVPVMLVVSVPASALVRAFEPGFALFTAGAAAVLLFVSRRVFRYALRRYRSASS